MTKWILGAGMIGLFLLALLSAGWAQQPPALEMKCGPRVAILDLVVNQFGERIVAVGTIGDAGNLMELTAARSGAWTMLSTPPGQGITCIVASGEGFDPIRARKPGRDS